MRPLGTSIASFVACCVASSSAVAGDGAAAILEVSRSSEAKACIDAGRLTKSVESRLRRAVFARSGSAPLALTVTLSRKDQAWVALVRIADGLGPLGQREISTEARHCSALDDSLSLVVALLVDTPPSRPPPPASAAPAAEPSSAPQQPPQPASAPTPLALPPDTPAPREPYRFAALAVGTLALGLLPGLAPGVGLAAGLSIPRGPRLRLGGEFYFERQAELEGGAGGAELHALRAGLELCGLGFGSARLGFELCGGEHIGQLAVDGVGFDRNLQEHRLTFSLDAGMDARLPLSQDFIMVVAARVEVPLARDRFVGTLADGSRALIFQQPPIGVVLKVGLEVAP